MRNQQNTAHTSKNLLVLSVALPSSSPDNAGARYVQWVLDSLSDNFRILVVAPDGRAARRAISSGQVPPNVLIGENTSALQDRFVNPFKRINSLLFPASQPWIYVYQLLCNRTVREAIRSADVIDLQWQEHGSLIPILRLINPKAHIVCTFHDVLSQRFKRAQESSKSYGRRARWGWAKSHASRSERVIMNRSDAVVVLSDKDAQLLPKGTAELHVVVPPIAEDLRLVTRASPSPFEVLFVGVLWRWENEDGLLWFLREVWPLVKKEVPSAVFRIAGDGASPELRTAAGVADVEVLGFVQNLIPLYESAAVVVVPLRLGAGVKFKVIDALSAGVPVVTTTVGAEGIGDAPLFAGLSDDPREFSQAVIESLTKPGNEKTAVVAKNVRHKIQGIYGNEQFKESMSRVYPAPRSLSPRETQEDLAVSTKAQLPTIVFQKIRDTNNPITLSVVIPVYNGAATLAEQLNALATQETVIPFEVVISDNGSTDNTRSLATKWADQFAAMKIVDSGQIQGVSHARNQGILAATGDKVLVCDADDVVSAEWVSSLEKSLNHFDMVGGRARLNRINTVAMTQGNPSLTEGLNSIFGFLPYALGASFGVSRAALISVGGFDSSYIKGHEEADLGWRMQLAGFTLGWCPEAVFDYRQRENSYSSARQNFHYAKSSILLWCRFSGENPLTPVSFLGSIRGLAKQILHTYKLIRANSRAEHARKLGWTIGTVVGHLHYRIIGSVPEPIVMVPNLQTNDR